MSRNILKTTGLAGLAVAALAFGGAISAPTTVEASPYKWSGRKHGGHGGGHGWGHGHGGGWGHGHGWRRGFYGPRVGFYVAPRYVRDCYRVWRSFYVPGEGYVRTKVRVCD